MAALWSCRTDQVAPGEDASNASARKKLTIATTTSVPDECETISFSNLPTGAISSVNTSIGTVQILGINPTYAQNASCLIDSRNPHPEDKDLGTPNEVVPNGPGVGAGGTTTNLDEQGNILIIQDFGRFGTTPNDADVVGRLLKFGFPTGVKVSSIKVFDVEQNEQENGEITLYNGTTAVVTIPILPNGANGETTINLGNVANITRIDIQVNGSMGFDDLVFCVPGTPPPPPGAGCTKTQGYWKNQEEAWPAQSLTIGGTSYTKAQLLQILRTPVKGNGAIQLFHQLIAAKLNIKSDANSTQVQQYVTAADNLLTGINPLNGGYLPTSQTSFLNDKLDEFNNGRLGAPNCSN